LVSLACRVAFGQLFGESAPKAGLLILVVELRDLHNVARVDKRTTIAHGLRAARSRTKALPRHAILFLLIATNATSERGLTTRATNTFVLVFQRLRLVDLLPKLVFHLFVLHGGLSELDLGPLVVLLDFLMLQLEHLFSLRAEIDFIRQVIRLRLHLANVFFQLIDFDLDAPRIVPLLLRFVPILLRSLLDICRPLAVLTEGVLDGYVLRLDHVDGVGDHLLDEELAVTELAALAPLDFLVGAAHLGAAHVGAEHARLA